MNRYCDKERPGIFGTETEYTVLYFPDDSGDPRTPPFESIESVLFQALLDGRKASLSSALKGGYFIENGGQIQMEIYLRRQADTPIIELSTPECRSPWDVLTYQRAFDRILEEVSIRSRDLLRPKGWAGRISFGKSNRDARGTGFGFHENYLVHQKTGRAQRALALLAAPLLAILFLPPFIFLLLVLLAVIFGSTLTLVFPRTRTRLKGFCERRLPRLKEHLRAAYFLSMNGLLVIPVVAYSMVLRATAVGPLRRDLTAFLVTRQILTGSGGLDFEEAVFELSQRPALTSTVSGIIMFGRRKTLFDLKGFLYDPLALFRMQQKLTITSGDSNLSDVPAILSIGATAMVIEMIESGADFSDLRLRRPLRSFREICRGGPWKQMAVGGAGDPDMPGRRTALGIQREYLRRAREFFAGRPEGRLRHGAILDLWQKALEDLSQSPGKLVDRLDWAAKKSLLDAAILTTGSWRQFFAWGRILECAPQGLAAECRSLEELVARTGLLRGALLRRFIQDGIRQGDIDPQRFSEARDRHYAARKIDLRFHEIGAEPGYQRRLEGQGLIQRLVSDEEILRAVRTPPQDTRARVRGYYISLSHSPESMQANWSSVTIPGSGKTVPLPDPFQFRIPGEG